MTRDQAIDTLKRTYGETAFARRLGDRLIVGWWTGARTWEYYVGDTWRDALKNAGLIQ